MKIRFSPLMTVYAGMVAAAVIGFAGINSYLPGGGDNAGYIAEAESLLKLGKRTFLYQVGTPPDTLKPPLFPAILSAVEICFGRNIPAMKVTLVLFAVLSVLAAFWVLRTGLRESLTDESNNAADWIAAGLAFWFAISPILIRFCHDVLSDVPFTAMSLIAIALAGRASRRDSKFIDGLLLIAALYIATQLRTAGILIAGACTGYLGVEAILKRHDSHAKRIVLLCCTLFFLSVFFLWCNRSEGQYVSFLKAGLTNSPAGNGLTQDRGFAQLARVSSYYLLLMPREVFSYDGLGIPEIFLLCILNALIIFTGIITMIWRGQRLIPICWGLYQGGILMWPAVDSRFFLPTLPLFLCLFWIGAREIFAKLENVKLGYRLLYIFQLALIPAASLCGTLFFAGQDEIGPTTEIEWIAGAILLSLILAAACWYHHTSNGDHDQLRRNLVIAAVSMFIMLSATRSICENVLHEWRWGPAPVERGWPGLFAAAQWLKSNANPDDGVASAEMSLIWLWSDRRGVPIPRTSDVALATEQLRNAKWAILDDLAEDQIAARFLKPVVAGRKGWEVCARFKGKGDEEGETVIFRRLN